MTRVPPVENTPARDVGVTADGPLLKQVQVDPLARAPTQSDVSEAYLWILGREVEAQRALEAYLTKPSLRELRELLLGSEEFANIASAGSAETAAGGAGDDPLSSPVRSEDVSSAHLWLLGREPSEASLAEFKLAASTRRGLRRILMDTAEFAGIYTEIGAAKGAGDPLARSPAPEDVRNAFLWVLGREVESEAALKAHVALPTRRHLRHALVSSQEFSEGYASDAAGASSRWVATEVLSCRCIWLDLYDRFVSRAVLTETWKQAETRLVGTLLKPGDGFIDAGANLGWFSVVAAERVGRFGQVLAFEPGERVRSYLERTVALNAWSSRVMVSPFALWDQNVSASLAQDDTVYNPGHSWVTTMSSVPDHPPIECRRLDDVADVPKLAMIKLAVEGAEFRALRGAERTLRAQAPIIMTELNAPMLREVSSASVRDLYDMMASYGYDCRIVERADPEGPETRAVTAAELEALDPSHSETLLFTR